MSKSVAEKALERKEELKIKVKYISEDSTKLNFIEGKSDWVDLYLSEDVNLKAGEYKLLPLGVCMELPKGYEAHILPRGSTFSKWGILQTNSMGIVDKSYCGKDDWWYMPIYATKDILIEKNSRVCQFRITKNMACDNDIVFNSVDELENENRGGFGSTGHK